MDAAYHPPLPATHEAVATALLLDVRRAAAYEAATDMIPGAHWRDPATAAQWAAQCPRDRPVVVYCVHGHEVSRGAAQQLRDAGVDARYLEGGIEGWKAAGRPVVAKGERP